MSAGKNGTALVSEAVPPNLKLLSFCLKVLEFPGLALCSYANYRSSYHRTETMTYATGANLSRDDIEERAKSIERSNRMLKMLDSFVDLLKTNHKHGEL